ncbi:hypothetical protein FKM82_025107 [Ascaphus truei]
MQFRNLTTSKKCSAGFEGIFVIGTYTKNYIISEEASSCNSLNFLKPRFTNQMTPWDLNLVLDTQTLPSFEPLVSIDMK